MGTASAVGEEVAVTAVEARQLGLVCCLACRAAAVKAMAMAKAKAKFAAPPWGRQSRRRFRLLVQVLQLRASGPDQLVCARASASASSIFRRAIDIYYVVHIGYILYICGLKPIGEGVIYECLHLQQLQSGPRAPPPS